MEVVRTVIIDDNPVFLHSALEHLARERSIEMQGKASTAEQGIKLVEMLRPDLVLVDVQLPGIDGYETMRRLKNLPDPPRVIALSLANDPRLRTRARHAGADDFLTKFELTIRLPSMALRLCGGTVT